MVAFKNKFVSVLYRHEFDFLFQSAERAMEMKIKVQSFCLLVAILVFVEEFFALSHFVSIHIAKKEKRDRKRNEEPMHRSL